MPAFNPFTPVLATLWRDRKMSLAVCAAGGAQAALVCAGLPGWPCPLMSATGIPCPGCGLTRAVVALFRGDWHTSLTTHAFAPLFLVALILTGMMLLLPGRLRLPLVSRAEALERRTGFATFALIGLVAYWLVRLFFFHEAFTRALKG